MSEIITVGLDLAKNVFQAHGVDASGQAVQREKLRRDQVLSFVSQLPPCIVAMEADDGAGCDVKRSKQRGRAVADVGVSSSLGHARRHRQYRLFTIPRLNLGLFVYAQYDSPVRCGMQRPTISCTLSTNSGSVESLKVSLRCGCNRRRSRSGG